MLANLHPPLQPTLVQRRAPSGVDLLHLVDDRGLVGGWRAGYQNLYLIIKDGHAEAIARQQLLNRVAHRLTGVFNFAELLH